MRTCLVVLVLTLVASAQHVHETHAGEQAREIKSLSPEEVQGLLNGEGMGFAKPAELNHYPGPRHVLELAEQLALSEEQKAAAATIFEDMRRRAVDFGKQVVESERELEMLFASGQITERQLYSLVAEIARLRGNLRATHLEAHIKMRALLTPEQIARYDQLRGYAQGAAHQRQH